MARLWLCTTAESQWSLESFHLVPGVDVILVSGDNLIIFFTRTFHWRSMIFRISRGLQTHIDPTWLDCFLYWHCFETIIKLCLSKKNSWHGVWTIFGERIFTLISNIKSQQSYKGCNKLINAVTFITHESWRLQFCGCGSQKDFNCRNIWKLNCA